jgi:hypothetical protein
VSPDPDPPSEEPERLDPLDDESDVRDEPELPDDEPDSPDEPELPEEPDLSDLSDEPELPEEPDSPDEPDRPDPPESARKRSREGAKDSAQLAGALPPAPALAPPPWHFLNFLPDPHQQGSLRPIWSIASTRRCSMCGPSASSSSTTGWS